MITLGAFWTKVHIPTLKRSARIGTLTANEHRWRLWIEPELGGLTWADITPPRLTAYVLGLREATQRARGAQGQPLSNRYIRSICASLSSVLSHAVEMGILAANPMSSVKRARPDDEPSERAKNRARCWTLAEARTFILSPVPTEPKRVEVASTIFMCRRGGEIRGLQVGDVHLDASTPFVHIERSYDGPTKNGKPHDVPIHPELQVILRAYLARLGDVAPSTLMFPARDGDMQGNPGAAWHALTARVGVPGIVYHGLRHTGASLYRESGLVIEDISAIIGHTRSSVTELYAPPALPVTLAAMRRLVLIGDDAGRVLAPIDDAPDTQRDVAPMSEPEPPTVRRAA